MASPLFTFALIADIQYADKVDGNFEGRTQRFRQVPAKLAAAVDAMLAEHAAPQSSATKAGGLTAVLHLGDIIDGYGEEEGARERSESDLRLIAGELQRLSDAGVPQRHVFGNHCFAVPRGELLERLGFPEGSSGYYSAVLGPGWRLLVLDTTDISLYGHDKDAPAAAEAAAWLQSHPLSSHPNAQPWNGGLSSRQLEWLKQQLAEAAAAGERTIVACHHPLAPGSAPDHYMSWSHEAVRDVLEAQPGVAVLVLTGHYHPGGASVVNGIHYVTMEGLLEAPPGSNSFALVDVYPNRISIRGQGCATSRELLLPKAP